MTAVTYSDFWGGLNAYALLANKAPMRNQLKRTMNREQMKVFSELADTLIGIVAGSTALATKGQVKHTLSNTEPVGPNSTQIETATLINRATTGADSSALRAVLCNVRRSPSPYARDLSGNGGPQFTAG